MDKRVARLKAFFSKKEITDYTYATLFFIIASLFAFLAIKPSLTIAFSLRREAADLEKINHLYEKNIENIIKIQSQLELVRDKIHLIDEATPQKPEVKIVLDNILQTATDQGVQLEPFDVPTIELTPSTKLNVLRTMPIALSLEGDYQILASFLKELIAKRRLTIIKSLSLTKADSSISESASLKSDMAIENYYL